jgi:hypothetical protein
MSQPVRCPGFDLGAKDCEELTDVFIFLEARRGIEMLCIIGIIFKRLIRLGREAGRLEPWRAAQRSTRTASPFLLSVCVCVFVSAGQMSEH